jgi:hypothetical protein
MQEKRLFTSMELSNKNWKLTFGDGSRERERTIEARRGSLLLQEVKVAKEKLGLPAECAVVFCYEAGRAPLACPP